MAKSYEYNGTVLNDEQVAKSAAANGMSVDDFLKESGFKETTPKQVAQPSVKEDIYEYNGTKLTASQIEKSAKANGMDVNSFLKESGFKKKELSATPSNNLQGGVQTQKPTSTPSQLGVNDGKKRGEFVTGAIFSDPKTNEPYQIQNGEKVYSKLATNADNRTQLNDYLSQSRELLNRGGSVRGVAVSNTDIPVQPIQQKVDTQKALEEGKVAAETKKAHQIQAVGNTATNRLKAKGIEPTKENLDKEVLAVNDDINKGTLSYNPQTKTYQRDAGAVQGFLKSLNKNLINASYGITKGVNAAFGGNNAEKEKQQAAELEAIDKDPYGSFLHSFNIFKTDEDKRLLEVAKKTGGDELNYSGVVPTLGGLGGDIAFFAASRGLGTGAKVGTVLATSYAKNYGEKSNEIYNQLKQKGFSDEDAAKKASIDATAQAIPQTAFEGALFGGILPHPKPTANFLSAVGQMAKRTAMFGGANATTQGFDEVIKKLQGYDTKGWEDRVSSAALSGLGLTALIEGLPVLAKLPKYAKSAFKEYANTAEVRPLVDEFLKTQPNGEEIKQQLDNYKATTEPLRGIVPDEKMASIGGMQEKRNSISAEIDATNDAIKNLEQSKKDSSPALAKTFDDLISKHQNSIEEKQAQIDAIDKNIKTFTKSDNPIEQEIDDATGENQRNEQTNIEQGNATIEPITPKEEVVTKTKVDNATQPTEEKWDKDVESTTKALSKVVVQDADAWDKIAFDEEKRRYKDDEEIAKEYHQAKANGTNPEFVKGVEKFLSEQKVKTPTEEVKVETQPIEVSSKGEESKNLVKNNFEKILSDANETNYKDKLFEIYKITDSDNRAKFEEDYKSYGHWLSDFKPKDAKDISNFKNLVDKIPYNDVAEVNLDTYKQVQKEYSDKLSEYETLISKASSDKNWDELNRLKEEKKQYIKDTNEKLENLKFAKQSKPTEVKAEQPNVAETKVKELRAKEQAELDAKIPNAEQYRVDGKVDRSKLTNDADKKAFDEVYDKYDKLITPLLEKESVKKNNIFTESDNPTREGKSKKALIDAKKEVFDRYKEKYGENVKEKVKDINTNFEAYTKALKEVGEIIKIEC